MTPPKKNFIESHHPTFSFFYGLYTLLKVCVVRMIHQTLMSQECLTKHTTLLWINFSEKLKFPKYSPNSDHLHCTLPTTYFGWGFRFQEVCNKPNLGKSVVILRGTPNGVKISVMRVVFTITVKRLCS